MLDENAGFLLYEMGDYSGRQNTSGRAFLVNMNEGEQVLHLWVCCAPFFETTLLVIPGGGSPTGLSKPEASPPAPSFFTFRMFDSDGLLFNEAQAQFPVGKVSIVELDPLMAACKFESGLKHAHLEVHCPVEAQCICRVHSGEGACIMGKPVELSNTRRSFFPVTFAQERFTFLSLINHGEVEASVRGRFFCGNRSPEALWAIAPHGSRLVGITSEFAEYVDVTGGQQLQAYIRLSLRGDYTVGAQLIDRSLGAKNGNLFSVIS